MESSQYSVFSRQNVESASYFAVPATKDKADDEVLNRFLRYGRNEKKPRGQKICPPYKTALRRDGPAMRFLMTPPRCWREISLKKCKFYEPCHSDGRANH